MNDKSVIGFSGRAHNGKTMLSEYLVQNHNFERLSVAGVLKRICANLLGFSSVEEMNKEKTTLKDYVIKENIDIENIPQGRGCKRLKLKEIILWVIITY